MTAEISARIDLDYRELSTILAALNFWMSADIDQRGEELCDIADDSGEIDPLSDEEIDELCERINTTGVPAPVVTQDIEQLLAAALVTSEQDAKRWRRAVTSCEKGKTPETSVECVSHLALKDAEQEIEQLLAVARRAVEIIDANLYRQQEKVEDAALILRTAILKAEGGLK